MDRQIATFCRSLFPRWFGFLRGLFWEMYYFDCVIIANNFLSLRTQKTNIGFFDGKLRFAQPFFTKMKPTNNMSSFSRRLNVSFYVRILPAVRLHTVTVQEKCRITLGSDLVFSGHVPFRVDKALCVLCSSLSRYRRCDNGWVRVTTPPDTHVITKLDKPKYQAGDNYAMHSVFRALWLFNTVI